MPPGIDFTNYSLILSHQVFWWTVLGVFGSLFATYQPAVGPMELLQSIFDDQANSAFAEYSSSNPVKWFLCGADYTLRLVDVSHQPELNGHPLPNLTRGAGLFNILLAVQLESRVLQDYTEIDPTLGHNVLGAVFSSWPIASC
jgi:hypothetical protein